MSLKHMQKIPFLQPLLWFDLSVHRGAFWKFAALWVLSVLPLVFSGLHASIPQGGSALREFISRVVSEFNSTSLFVYAISFLVPILYLLYERLQEYRLFAFSRESPPKHLELPPGYDLVLFVAFLVFVFTAFTYGSTTTGGTVLDVVITWGGVVLVYLYSLYCWYLTMLMEALAKEPVSFMEDRRSEEAEFTGLLSARVSKGGDDE